MASSKRKKAEDALLTLLACGATVEAAAQKCRISERTAYRRKADPDFQRQLQALRGEMVQRAAGMLTAAALEAVKTLLLLQDAAISAAVRLGAARAILEMGLKVREATDLEQRLSALEQLYERGQLVVAATGGKQ
jgi:hypothetical protein